MLDKKLLQHTSQYLVHTAPALNTEVAKSIDNFVILYSTQCIYPTRYGRLREQLHSLSDDGKIDDFCARHQLVDCTKQARFQSCGRNPGCIDVRGHPDIFDIVYIAC